MLDSAEASHEREGAGGALALLSSDAGSEPASVDGGALGSGLGRDATVDADASEHRALADASAEPDAAAEATAAEVACVGQAVRYEGICWHLARRDTSCAQSCATRGGFEPQSLSWMGTPEQGGAASHCGEVLARLGRGELLDELGEPRQGQRDDGVGAGCHLFGAELEPWWLSAPPHSATARLDNARLVCGCRV